MFCPEQLFVLQIYLRRKYIYHIIAVIGYMSRNKTNPSRTSIIGPGKDISADYVPTINPAKHQGAWDSAAELIIEENVSNYCLPPKQGALPMLFILIMVG
jgi:hypothetical protein